MTKHAPRGKHENLWTRPISESLFRKAKQQFHECKYSECIKSLGAIIEGSRAVVLGESSVFIRDAVILQAWSLYHLCKYDKCNAWIAEISEFNMIAETEPEIDLILYWMLYRNAKYQETIKGASDFIEKHAEELHPLLSEFLFLRGWAKYRIGESTEAEIDSNSAYHLYMIQGKTREAAEASNLLGNVYLQLAQFRLAVRAYDVSLKINYKMNDEHRIGYNMRNQAIAYYKLGLFGLAYRELVAAKKLYKKNNATLSFCRTQLALGNICRLRGDFGVARKHLMSGYSLATKERIPREECLALEFLGDVFRDENKPAEARRYYARGMKIAQKIAPDGDLVMELLRRDGECLFLLDRAVEALPILARARTRAQKLGDRFEEGVILRCLASASAAIAEWDSLHTYLESGLRILQEISAWHLCRS